jgi:hypothetical protein
MTTIEAPAPDQAALLVLGADFDQSVSRDRAGLEAATDTVAEHYPAGGMCSCFRPLPCGVREVLEGRRDQFEQALTALLGDTRLLPIVPTESAVETPVVKRSRRRLRSLLRRMRSASTLKAPSPGRPA